MDAYILITFGDLAITLWGWQALTVIFFAILWVISVLVAIGFGLAFYYSESQRQARAGDVGLIRYEDDEGIESP